MKRLITERDYTLLLQLRDIAVALDDQINAITDTVGELIGVAPSDDGITDLICNRGEISEFLELLGIRVVYNGNAGEPDEPPSAA